MTDDLEQHHQVGTQVSLLVLADDDEELLRNEIAENDVSSVLSINSLVLSLAEDSLVPNNSEADNK